MVSVFFWPLARDFWPLISIFPEALRHRARYLAAIFATIGVDGGSADTTEFRPTRLNFDLLSLNSFQ